MRTGTSPGSESVRTEEIVISKTRQEVQAGKPVRLYPQVLLSLPKYWG